MFYPFYSFGYTSSLTLEFECQKSSRLVKVFHEDRVDELLDDHSVLLAATAQDLGVGELVEAGCLAGAALLPLLVVQKEIVLSRLRFV